MRVIAGETKGCLLQAVPGRSTRPTSDKVKEAIFNMIGPFFQGGLGLDLYAGSGALGIEALSRGLDKVIFVDRDYRAIQTIKKNLQKCELEMKAEVYRNDAKRALNALMKREIEFTHIFLDPPYKKHTIITDLKQIAASQLLQETACVIVEHAHEMELPLHVEQLQRQRREVYGNTAISIFSFT